MSLQKKSTAIAITLAAVVTVAGWALNWGVGVSADYVHEIRKNIEIFGLVYQEISKKYVDPVDPDKFMKAGISGMLETLDPYTVLVEQEANSHLQIITTGKYGGLGMRIGEREGWPTVVDQPFEHDPAGKAGIREGDRIISVDGATTKGMSIGEVARRLRGEIGTAVTIKVEREGEAEPLEFRLIRAEITVLDVSYSGLVEDGIGYIKLAGFSKNAGYEIQQAIRDMKAQGLKGLVLDLRSNPGGLLDAAVSVAENFVVKGEMIVSTKGRMQDSAKEYRSTREPSLGDLPLVILVNEFSASASEIVAGAIQDLDRGIIIGAPTYGKGLVQTVVPITQDAALKITTAKYYIPSGRLIQRQDRLGNIIDHSILRDDGEFEDGVDPDAPKPDSQRVDSSVVFHTKSGRDVFGGGGIKPDIALESPKLSRYEYALVRKSMMFHFALIYATGHQGLPRDFAVNDSLLEEFRHFLEEKTFSYDSKSEEILTEFKKVAEDEGYLETLNDELGSLQQALRSEKRDDFTRSRDFIRRELEKEIAAKAFGTRARVEVSFDDDEFLKEALKVLQDRERYITILGINSKREG